ncbi:MAG: WD40 repeat domain-containing protein, partial [Planctomycetes bacterium]|nr:WD40 repeat domain-containing protein [Planctomycetota bacterium]
MIVLQGDRKTFVVAFSPDNKWLLASSGYYGCLWDLTAENISSSLTRLDTQTESDWLISQDGRQVVAIGTQKKNVRTWDLTTNDWASEDMPGQVVAMSPDKRWFLISVDGEQRLWDSAIGMLPSPAVLLPLSDRPESVARGPQGRWLAAADGSSLTELTVDEAGSSLALPKNEGSESGNALKNRCWLLKREPLMQKSIGIVQLWDLTTENPTSSKKEWLGHKGGVLSMKFSPNGQWLVTADDKTVRLWNLTTDDPASSVVELHGFDHVIQLTISSDSRWLVTHSESHYTRENYVRLWDLSARDPAATSISLRGHDDAICAVNISPDCRWLVTGGRDETIRLWDLTTPRLPSSATVLQWADMRREFVMSADARWLATNAMNNGELSLQLWNLRPKRGTAAKLSAKEEIAVFKTISEDSHWLATDQGRDTVQLWDLSGDDAKKHSMLKVAGYARSLRFSHDSQRLFAGTSDGEVYCWDITMRGITPLKPLRVGENHPVRELELSRDGRWMVTVQNQVVHLWDLEPDVPIRTRVAVPVPGVGSSLSVSFTADSRWLLVHVGYNLYLLDLATEDPASSHLELGRFGRTTTSPDGRWLAAQESRNKIAYIDLTAENLMQSKKTLAGHEKSPSILTFSPDSRWLVSGSSDNTARMWDLSAENPAENSIVFSGHNGMVRGLAMSRSGRW